MDNPNCDYCGCAVMIRANCKSCNKDQHLILSNEIENPKCYRCIYISKKMFDFWNGSGSKVKKNFECRKCYFESVHPAYRLDQWKKNRVNTQTSALSLKENVTNMKEFLFYSYLQLPQFCRSQINPNVTVDYEARRVMQNAKYQTLPEDLVLLEIADGGNTLYSAASLAMFVDKEFGKELQHRTELEIADRESWYKTQCTEDFSICKYLVALASVIQKPIRIVSPYNAEMDLMVMGSRYIWKTNKQGELPTLYLMHLSRQNDISAHFLPMVPLHMLAPKPGSAARILRVATWNVDTMKKERLILETLCEHSVAICGVSATLKQSVDPDQLTASSIASSTGAVYDFYNSGVKETDKKLGVGVLHRPREPYERYCLKYAESVAGRIAFIRLQPLVTVIQVYGHVEKCHGCLLQKTDMRYFYLDVADRLNVVNAIDLFNEGCCLPGAKFELFIISAYDSVHDSFQDGIKRLKMLKDFNEFIMKMFDVHNEKAPEMRNQFILSHIKYFNQYLLRRSVFKENIQKNRPSQNTKDIWEWFNDVEDINKSNKITMIRKLHHLNNKLWGQLPSLQYWNHLMQDRSYDRHKKIVEYMHITGITDDRELREMLKENTSHIEIKNEELWRYAIEREISQDKLVITILKQHQKLVEKLNDSVQFTATFKKEFILLMGDFNANVGSDHEKSKSGLNKYSWMKVVGPGGIGVETTNGIYLLWLCQIYNLAICNTQLLGQATYGSSQTLTDYVIVRQVHLQLLRSTQVAKQSNLLSTFTHMPLIAEFDYSGSS